MNYAQCHEIYIDNLKRISRAANIGTRHALTRHIRKHLRSRAAAFEVSYDRMPESSDAEIEAVALSINLFAPYRGSILYWMKPKSSGGQRMICALPAVLQMRQTIISDVIKSCTTFGPHLYLLKGRGRDRLARDTLTALREGFVYGWQSDLRAAYDNVNISEFLREKVPIPETVIRNTLYYEGTDFWRVWQDGGISRLRANRYMPATNDTVPEGPRGLIQGAASSAVIFNLLLNQLSQAVSESVRLFVYGDNVLALARSEAERDAAGCQLGLALRGHPAGPFRLTEQAVSLARGFEHLGYRFERDRNSNEPAITLGRKKRLSLLANMMEVIERANQINIPISVNARKMARGPHLGYPALTNLEEIAGDLIFVAEAGAGADHVRFANALSKWN